MGQWVSLSSWKLSLHRREQSQEEIGLSAWPLSPPFTSFILCHQSGLSSFSHTAPSLSYEHLMEDPGKELASACGFSLCPGLQYQPIVQNSLKMLAHVLLPDCTTAIFLQFCFKSERICVAHLSLVGLNFLWNFVFLIALQPQLSDRVKRMILLDTDFVLLGFFFFSCCFLHVKQSIKLF